MTIYSRITQQPVVQTRQRQTLCALAVENYHQKKTLSCLYDGSMFRFSFRLAGVSKFDSGNFLRERASESGMKRHAMHKIAPSKSVNKKKALLINLPAPDSRRKSINRLVYIGMSPDFVFVILHDAKRSLDRLNAIAILISCMVRHLCVLRYLPVGCSARACYGWVAYYHEYRRLIKAFPIGQPSTLGASE